MRSVTHSFIKKKLYNDGSCIPRSKQTIVFNLNKLPQIDPNRAIQRLTCVYLYHRFNVALVRAFRNCLRDWYFTNSGRGIGYSFQLAITAPLYSIIDYCIATAQSYKLRVTT